MIEETLESSYENMNHGNAIEKIDQTIFSLETDKKNLMLAEE